MQELKFASIGGWQVHTDKFVGKVNDYPGCEVTAVWDPDAVRGKERAEKFSCSYMDTYEEVLKDPAIDAVLITSPTRDHYEQIMQALSAGKHVFVEKPAFYTPEEGYKVRDLLAESGLSFVISDPIRTSERQLLAAKELMDSGKIGTIVTARTRCAMGMALESDHLDGFDPEISGGGIMYDLGCHAAHMLALLLGKPQKVHAAFGTMSAAAKEYGVEDSAIAVYEYGGGVLGVVETSALAERREDYFLVSGTKGSILGLDKEVRYRAEGGDWVTVPESSWPQGSEYPLYAWIDNIRDGKEMKGVGIEDAILYTEMIAGAYEAAKQSVPIR